MKNEFLYLESELLIIKKEEIVSVSFNKYGDDYELKILLKDKSEYYIRRDDFDRIKKMYGEIKYKLEEE